MRQQLPDLTGPLRWQLHQHIIKIGIRIMPIYARRLGQTHDRCRTFAATQRPGKQPVRAPECSSSYLVLDLVVIDEAVIEDFGHG